MLVECHGNSIFQKLAQIYMDIVSFEHVKCVKQVCLCRICRKCSSTFPIQMLDVKPATMMLREQF
jgi:hypothetical protein